MAESFPSNSPVPNYPISSGEMNSTTDEGLRSTNWPTANSSDDDDDYRRAEATIASGQSLRTEDDKIAKLKAENRRLRRENRLLKDENDRLFAQQVAGPLEEEKKKNEVMVGTLRELVDKLETSKEQQRRKEEAAAERAKELELRITEMEEDFKCLQVEKDEHDWLRLENERLLTVCKENEEAFAKFKVNEEAFAKFKVDEEAKAAMLDRDAVVSSLRQDLIRLQRISETRDRDFEFYKRHANAMLRQERAVNARIRSVLNGGCRD